MTHVDLIGGVVDAEVAGDGVTESGGLRLRVQSRTCVADGVVRLELCGVDGEQLPQWTPGAHVSLALEPGLVRQYSLCGSRSRGDRYAIAVLLEPNGRGGSRYVHERLELDHVVRVSAPRNNFELRDAEKYLFIAGGIGITPIIPMIAEVESRGCDWRLVYGGRQRSSMAFADELAERYGDRVEVRPQADAGHLPVAQLVDELARDSLVYACGPAPLLEALETECRRADVLDRLETERFVASPEVAPRADDSEFRVVLQVAGLDLVVPSSTSILDVIEGAGVAVDSSCREGTCGTCETGVIEGVPDHRDALLSDEERAANDTMMICVSRCKGARLVLDL